MNMRRLIYLFLCICTVIITSCGINSKESYLESFESFITDIEQTKSFSDEELTEVKKEYLDFTETYYNKFESELTTYEEELILELKARYYTVIAKQGLKDVGKTLKDLGEQASEFINDILE